ncbi:hypothetical protein [Oceanobacter mangrovi]|uniref:hypothetical protein n=1 Tax=Oceanobacter mangrovi TaxID=2862510 RepID=UPI001C8DCC26|nr:hypothetical protein [Oceanobacter mangrovi]
MTIKKQNSRLTNDDIATMKDIFLLLEEKHPTAAYDLLKIIQKNRPNSPLIQTRLSIDSLPDAASRHYNIHIGIHKTATTFLQQQLEISFKNDLEIKYIPLNQLRNWRKKKGFYFILEHLQGYKKSIISDENIIGSAAMIKSGQLYTKVFSQVSRYINSTGKNNTTVFISLRSYHAFLTSIYCEYLRHNPFIRFSIYIQKIIPDTISWYEVFSPLIFKYPEVEFQIFNFDNFEKNKTTLLKNISFGQVSEFSPDIPVSRATFSEYEIAQLSGDKEFIESASHSRFQPFSEQEIADGKARFQQDLERFAELPNVTLF